MDNKEEATSDATQEEFVTVKLAAFYQAKTTKEAIKESFSVEGDAEIIDIDSRVEAKSQGTKENLIIDSKSEASPENFVTDSTSEAGQDNVITGSQFEAKQENFITESKSEATKENLIIDGQFEAPQESFIVKEQLDVNLLPEGFFDYSDNR